ncbi:hypothetical protein Patl1_13579 [Pistacia atlantica]|uniref:Uncharacterized protein n=1 Tax=Pistacia atlantica TaxID=434234 RepID=A0ACC1ATP9_9ROSI|nr:hypothetical protein Patl1_13579 [Pistacia atlantica]
MAPPNIPFTSLLFKCKTIQQLKQTHSQLLIRGLNHPPRSLRPIISLAALNPFGDIHYALLLLFQSSTPPQIFLFNTLIRGLARACRPHSLSTSCSVFYRMIDSNIIPNNFTFTFLFQGCANCGDFDLGRQLHGMVVKNSFALDVFVKNSVIQLYSVCGKLRDARCVFDESMDIDVVSWNSMINGYIKNGEISEGLELFDKMPHRNEVSWNGVLGGLVKFGFLDDVCRVFKEMPCKSLVSWVVMISGYAQNGRPKEALALFREMQLLDLEPNSAILVSVLSACSQLGALDHGNWVYSYIQKKCVNVDSILSAALVDMYAKCGSIDLAMQNQLNRTLGWSFPMNDTRCGLPLEIRIRGIVQEAATLHSKFVYRSAVHYCYSFSS